jgi:arylsulfatase A
MHSPSAVCSPTRYGLLTGRYCWRTSLKRGVLQGYSPNLIEAGRLTVPSFLKTQGYHTAGFGKWHLGLRNDEKTDYNKPLHPGPTDHGFDYYFGIPASLDMEPYLYFENDRVIEQPTGTTPGSNSPRGVFWRPGACAPHFKHEQVLPNLTDRVVEFIGQRKHQPEPFFLYFALPSPHTPWLPTSEFRGRSRAGDYGDYVEEVDHTLGRVLQALDEADLADNTLLVFTSDNGADWKLEDLARYAHRANADWRGEKADVWEGGHRIPFIVRWPGMIPRPAVSQELGCLTDLLATLASIQGVPLPDNAAEDSFNLLPALLQKNATPIRDSIILHSAGGMFSIRQAFWKLEEGLGSGGFSPPVDVAPAPSGPKGQLYDLRTDPQELQNLYQDRPEIVDRLATLLSQAKSSGHTRPLART